jgi:hypothetical protein
MATLSIRAYPIQQRSVHGYLTIRMTGGECPCQQIEVTKLDECEAAVAKFVAALADTGKPFQVSARITQGRKPRGFDKAMDRQWSVNVAAAPLIG